MNKTKVYLMIIFFGCLLALGFLVFYSSYAPKNQNKVEAEIINEENSNILFGNLERKVEEEMIESDIQELKIEDQTEEENKDNIEADNFSKPSTEELAKSESEAAPVWPALPMPLEREKKKDELRIGFITDIHSRSEWGLGKKLEKYYSDNINYFIEQMNNKFSPDFIIVNGDIIEGTKVLPEIGMKEARLLKDIFDRTNIKKYWVLGNHDLRSLTKDQWQETMGVDYLNKSFEVGDYKIIILDSNFNKNDEDVYPKNSYTRGKVSQKEIVWLEQELKNTKKKIIVFIHHPPLWNVDIKSNNWLLQNARDLQNIFSEFKVLAVFAGHIEDSYFSEIGGVKYYVFPGTIKNEKYPGTFSALTINDSDLSIEMSYLRKGEKYRTVKIID